MQQASSQSYEQSHLESERIQLEQAMKSGTNWFYWIAALSLVNTAISFSGTNRAFGLGLGVTQIFDAFANELDGGLRAIPLIMGLTITAGFALFGYLGGNKQTWAIVTGMSLYLLDGLLLLLLAVLGLGLPIIGILIHAYALYGLFNGFSACRELKKLEAERGMMPPQPPTAFR